MNKADFELNLLLPADARLAQTMRALAAHAARYAGCDESDAERYGAAVESIVGACLAGATAGAELPVILRRGAGPIELLIGCETQFEVTHQGGVTVGWIREQGSTMCRIALEPGP